MSEDLNIKIKASLNEKSSEDTIKEQLKKIQKNLDLKINTDDSSLKDIQKELASLQKQMKDMGKNEFRVVNDKEAIKNINKAKDGMSQLFSTTEKAVQYYEKLGSVNIKENLDPVTNKLKDVTLEVKKATGEVEKLKFETVKVGNDKAIELVSKQNIDKTQELYDKTLKYQEEAKDNINKRKQEQAELNKKIQHQIDLYKEEAKLKVNNMKRRYGSILTSNELSDLNQWEKKVENLSANSTPKLRREMSKLNLEFKKVNDSALDNAHRLDLANKSSLTLVDALKQAMVKFPIWMAASTAFFGSIRVTEAAIGTIIEVDTAITNLKKVMDQDTNFNSMLEDATVQAKELGKTITEVLESYEEFARQGSSQQEIKLLSSAALIASNVGEIQAGQAAEYLTAAMTQMQLEAKDAMSVIDSWNELANKNATTVEKLAQGHTRAGSTAKSFGADLHELNAVIGAVTQATKQSGREVGNFVKAAFPRLLMNPTQDALRGIGVEVMKNADEMKDALDIYAEVAEKYQYLTNIQRNEIAEALGGKYHISRVTALLDNFDLYDKMLDESMNSLGSAAKENETYLESLEARIKRLQATFQELALTVGDAVLTDSFIAVVESLRIMAELGTTVSKGFGVLPIIFGTLSSSLIMLSSRFRMAAVEGNILKSTFTGLSVSANALKIALRSLGIGLVFAGIGIALEKLISKIADYNKKQKELKKENDEIVSNYKSHSDEVETLAKKYELLSDKVKNGEISSDNQEYLDVQNKINELMPNLTAEIDEQGNARLRSVDAVKQELQYARKLKENYQQMEVENFQNDLSEKAEEFKRLKDDIDRFRVQSSQSTYVGVEGGVPKTQAQQLDAERKLIQNQRELQVLMSRTVDFAKQKADTFLSASGASEKLSNKEKELVGTFIESNKEMIEASSNSTQYENSLNRLINKATTLGEKLSTLPDSISSVLGLNQIEGLSDDQIGLFDGLVKSLESGTSDWMMYAKELKRTGVNQFQLNRIIDETKEKISSQSAVVRESSLNHEEIVEQYENATSAISDLNGMLEELNEDHELSSDSIKTIMSDYPDLIQYLNDEATLTEKLAEKKLEKVKIAQQAMIQELMLSEEFYNSILNGESELLNQLGEYYNIDLQNFNSLAEAKLAVENQLLSKLARAWGEYYNAQSNSLAMTEAEFVRLQQSKEGKSNQQAYAALGEITSDIAYAKQAMQQAASDFEGLTLDLGGLNTQSLKLEKIGNSSGTGSGKEKKDKGSKDDPTLYDTTSAIINEIQDSNTLLKTNEELLNHRKKFAEEEEDYQKQIEITSKLLENQQTQIENIGNETGDIGSEDSMQYNLNQLATSLRDKSGYSADQWSKWINENEELTAEFYNHLNSLGTGSSQKELNDLANSLIEVKKQYEANKKSSQDLRLSSAELEKSLQTLQIDAFEHSLKSYRDSMDDLDFSIGKAEKTLSLYDKGSKEHQETLVNLIGATNDKKKATEKELDKVKELMDATKEGTSYYKHLEEQYEDLTLAVLDYESSIADLINTQEDSLEQFAEQAVQIYKEVYGKQRDLALDALDEEIKAHEKNHQDKMADLDEELAMYEKIYNEKIKQIDREASDEDYDKDLSKAQTKLASLKEQLDILTFDTSLQGKLKRKELTAEIEALVLDIEDMEADRTRELRKRNLQDNLEEKREEIQEERDKQQDIYEIMQKRFEKEREEINRHWENVINDERRWTKLRNKIQSGHTDFLKEDFKEFEEFLDTNMDDIGKSFSNNLIDRMNSIRDSIAETIAEIQKLKEEAEIEESNTDSGDGGYKKGEADSDYSADVRDKKGYDQDKWDEIERISKDEGVDLGVAEDMYKTNEKLGYKKYHEGGTVGESPSGRLSELVNKLFNVKPNEQVVKALKGELMIPQHNIPNFISNINNLVGSLTPQSSSQLVTLSPTFNFEIKGNMSRNEARKATDYMFERISHNLTSFGR